MAAHTLETCLEILTRNTEQPELFLRAQDALATDFTSLTKTLYDLHKAQKLDGCKGSPLDQLMVENFDEEQIWQELELQNTAVLTDFEKAVDQAVQDDTLTVLADEEGSEDDDHDNNDKDLEEEEEEEDGDEEEKEEEDDEDDDEEGSDDDKENRLKPKSDIADEEDDFSDEDSDIDFDVDKLEEQAKQKKNKATKSPKLRTVSEVDDKFFKLSEMEAFLDDMDKREGKESVGVEIDYFQELPSDEEEEELDFDKPATSKTQKKPKSSRDVKYKDYFMEEETDEPTPGEEVESAPDDEEAGETDEDFEEEEDMDME